MTSPITPYNPAQFVLMTPMWEVFTDKDTLDFLAGGYALFFEDNDRANYKVVYELVDTGGGYPNYGYQPYGFLNGSNQWQVNLNAQGAFDQVVYGFIEDTDGNPQQYFVQFYNSAGVFQFSREAWPNIDIGTTPSGTAVSENFVPNPQFILHTNVPNPFTAGSVVGQLTQQVTNIAYGGWTFERASNASTDIVLFPRIGSFITPPPDGNPRYGVNIICTSPAGQAKFLGLKFSDVNKFATTNATPTPPDSNAYTFAFTAINNGSGTIPLVLELIRFFGTGGSPNATLTTTLTTFTITTSYPSTYFTFSFDFPSNSGLNIGTNDDDYVQLALAPPPGSSYNITLNNFILTPGIVDNPAFPQEPDSIYVYRSLFNSGRGAFPTSLPDYNSLNLGMPLILGVTGVTYDLSSIGEIHITMISTPGFGELVCDGSVSYDTTLYSSDGIPYSRLGSKIFNNSLNCPLFGTGPGFVTTNINSTGSTMRLVNNSAGPITTTADGTTPTGFSFHPCHTGVIQSSVGVLGHYANTNLLYMINSLQGLTLGPSGDNEEIIGIESGTSGFTTFNYVNTQYTRSFYGVATTASSAISPGTWFRFYTMPVSSVMAFYVWFTVDGTGSDPAPGGIGIPVALYNSTFAMTADDVAQAIAEAVSGYQNSFITTLAGSAITAGSYFTFSSSIKDYYAWYSVNGSGTDPMPADKIGIQVPILSSDSDSMVATKTQIALNSRYFAAPDIRGFTMRFWSNGLGNLDLDQATRWSTNSIIIGDVLGTYEWYDVQAHNHQVGAFNDGLPTKANGPVHPIPPPGDLSATDTSTANDFNSGFDPDSPEWGYSGYSNGSNNGGTPGTETRAVNIYVNGFIKY
ncbi:MAG TPA: hypothetical protein VHZ76_00665 [Gammaproteobacteria bacterium]|jgi:hypothetical protein|nr:hypothetical protein [Gammaproteobacteria bacterium]